MQFTLTASHVQHHAAALLRTELRLKDFGAIIGRPWRKEQKLACLAAWVAVAARQ